MSADELRTAAATLRERASAATPGPWTFTDSEDASSSAHIDGDGQVVMRDEYTPVALCSNDFYEADPGEVTPADDVAYIAMMHPGVGLALADWLDAMGAIWDGGGKYVFGSTEQRALAAMDVHEPDPTSLGGRVFALARLINASAS